MAPSIGLSVTPGDHIGEKEETSDWLEESTTSSSKEIALGLFPLTPGLRMSETRLNWLQKICHLSLASTNKNQPAEENLQLWFLSMWQAQDLMSTSMLKICLKTGIGETWVESTIFHGPKTSTFLNTAAAAGLRGQLVLLLIESILQETKPGLISPSHLKW